MIPVGEWEDMLSFPYNSELATDMFGQEYEDRLYDSQDFADYFRQFVGNGVFPNPATNLRVDSPNNSMVLTVRRGSAFLQGRFYLQRRDFNFAVQPSHMTLGRRDIVICRHDIIARTSQVFYVPGVPSATPTAPAIVRTDDIFDLQLCAITVNPNATVITQANILDTRPNNAVCGFVTGLIHQVDTSVLFNQYKAYFDEQVAYWNNRLKEHDAQWDAWVENFNTLFGMLETKTFSLVNHDFDDWSVKRGCDKTTVFSGNTITETWTVVYSGFILAVKNTTFEPDGSITEVVSFNPWENTEGLVTAVTILFGIRKRTIFNADGSIREEIR